MTREDAIKMAKAALECIGREVSGCDEMCNCHKCDECALNYEKGNMGEQKEWLRLAIKALEHEPIIDNIRAEIEHLHDWAFSREEILRIIDKYRTESEA